MANKPLLVKYLDISDFLGRYSLYNNALSYKDEIISELSTAT